MGMIVTIEEAVGFLLNLVLYLNAGTLTLIISLAFERLGVKVTRGNFKRQPVKSLFLGLCLILASGIIAIIIQTRLSGYEPLVAFLILFTAYVALAQV